MEKVAKRSRPTWTQVRELEAEIAELESRVGDPSKELEQVRLEYEKRIEEQVEGTSALVSELDGWREKYRELNERYERLVNRGFWARLFNLK